MSHHLSARTDFRFLTPFLAPLVIGLLMLAVDVATFRAAPAAGQPADIQLTTGDLGVAAPFVTDATIVHTPDGATLAGIEGIHEYLHTLATAHPGAVFQTSGSRTVHDLLIVDWQGTVDGEIVLPGRTLITIDDGAIAEIRFLNLNHVAPPQPAPAAHASPTVTGAAPESFATDAGQDRD